MSGYIPFRKIDIWLQGYRSIWLSTTRPDGRPHAAPVWYWWDGRSIYFATGKNSQKAKNLAQQNWVVFQAGDGDDTIILQGRAKCITDVAKLERINTHYMEKYVDPFSGTQATIPNENDLVFGVFIQHIMAWEYGSVQTRTDWRFYHNDN